MGLEVVEFVMDIEETFNLDIPDTDLSTMVTIGDFYRYLCHRLNASEEPPPLPLTRAQVATLSPTELLAPIPLLPPQPRPVWDRLATILLRQGAPPALIRSDTRFVQDLDWG